MSRSDDLPSAPLDGQTASETAYFREVSGLKSKADGADYQEGGVHGGSHGSPSAHEPPSAAGEIAGTPPSIPLAPDADSQMVQALADAERSALEDLRSEMADVQTVNEQKQQDRLNKSEQIASNVLKKQKATEGSIIENMESGEPELSQPPSGIRPPILPPVADPPLRTEPEQDDIQRQVDVVKTALQGLTDEWADQKERYEGKQEEPVRAATDVKPGVPPILPPNANPPHTDHPPGGGEWGGGSRQSHPDFAWLPESLPAEDGGKNTRRRGIIGGALLGILALVGLGVVVTRPWAPGATTQPVVVAPTSTTAPAATTATTATTAPTATVPPTATTAPAKPPKLSVTPPQGAVTCVGSNWATIIVKNTGGKTLHWQVSAPGSVILTPASGTLAPNATQTVTLNGQYPSGQSFNVAFTSDGGQATAAITCS